MEKMIKRYISESREKIIEILGRELDILGESGYSAWYSYDFIKDGIRISVSVRGWDHVEKCEIIFGLLEDRDPEIAVKNTIKSMVDEIDRYIKEDWYIEELKKINERRDLYGQLAKNYYKKSGLIYPGIKQDPETAVEMQRRDIMEKLAARARAEEAAGKTNKLHDECAKYAKIPEFILYGISDGLMGIKHDTKESSYYSVGPEERMRIVNTTLDDEKPQEEANATFREYIEKRFSRRD